MALASKQIYCLKVSKFLFSVLFHSNVESSVHNNRTSRKYPTPHRIEFHFHDYDRIFINDYTRICGRAYRRVWPHWLPCWPPWPSPGCVHTMAPRCPTDTVPRWSSCRTIWSWNHTHFAITQLLSPQVNGDSVKPSLKFGINGWLCGMWKHTYFHSTSLRD